MAHLAEIVPVAFADFVNKKRQVVVCLSDTLECIAGHVPPVQVNITTGLRRIGGIPPHTGAHL